MVFADDLSVAAMLDWEGATLGPPEIDVAWWVMFDEFLCEANGLTRLSGVHDRSATLQRYAELAGQRPARHRVLRGARRTAVLDHQHAASPTC